MDTFLFISCFLAAWGVDAFTRGRVIRHYTTSRNNLDTSAGLLRPLLPLIVLRTGQLPLQASRNAVSGEEEGGGGGEEEEEEEDALPVPPPATGMKGRELASARKSPPLPPRLPAAMPIRNGSGKPPPSLDDDDEGDGVGGGGRSQNTVSLGTASFTNTVPTPFTQIRWVIQLSRRVALLGFDDDAEGDAADRVVLQISTSSTSHAANVPTRSRRLPRKSHVTAVSSLAKSKRQERDEKTLGPRARSATAAVYVYRRVGLLGVPLCAC
mmetsp:Transcript_45033/g.88614  ORF Transcript_45033/g.88614 Transcript_45033/m.88614 type:complete len:268 (+) Transcript_45033:104-907(+)